MRATAREGIAHRARHRARLAASARALGFEFDAPAFDAVLDKALPRLLATLQDGEALRLRLALRHDGAMALTHATLDALPAGPVSVLIAEAPLPAARPLAGHKSTQRAEYDAGMRAAQSVGAFDTLFFGAEGQLVEGGRCNVFVRLEGRWYTPPLADGALPGVMRAVLLADAEWAASERRITRAELGRAEALIVCNALRGAVPAALARDT
jgi:para-aminobenzoate synthetase/4-amino-4-deoxychorismate lyase